MMTLYTRIEKYSGSGPVTVLWSTGKNNKGCLHIHPDVDIDDMAIMAELVAIRHLLFTKQVFDRAPDWGKGYVLNVSKGAIRKLVLGKSSKKHLLPYAAFLRARMQGADVLVSHEKIILEGEELCFPENVQVTDEHRETHDRVMTPSMGIIYLTRHAVEQYVNRITSGTPKNPWRSLTKRLQHPNLTQVRLPANVLKHKESRYGKSNNVEAWKSGADMTFIILNENNRRTVVTVFDDNSAIRKGEEVYRGSF